MKQHHGAPLRDKTIRHRICYSKSLTRCSIRADLSFHRFLFFADDWGCFEYDIEVIHSLVFAKRKNEITEKDVAKWLEEYKENGMLFRWRQGDKEYGFFVNTDEHSAIAYKRRHKRKTPIPPEDAVKEYKDMIYKKFHNGKKPEETKDDNIESPF